MIMTDVSTRTRTSLTTLNAFSKPAYENMTLTNAFVVPYTVAASLPSKAFRKFALGSFTEVWPPRTTNPLIPILLFISILLLGFALCCFVQYQCDQFHNADSICDSERPSRIDSKDCIRCTPLI